MTEQICASIGPRIGSEGTPRCARAAGHSGLHRGFDGSGFESERWGAPTSRDVDFAREAPVPVEA